MTRILTLFLVLLCLQTLSECASNEHGDARKVTKKSFGSHQFNSYLSFPEMETWLQELQRAHPDKVRLEVAGGTHEGRDIHLVTVSDDVTRSADLTLEDELDQLNVTLGKRDEGLSKRPLEGLAENRFMEPSNAPSILTDKRERRNQKPVIFVDAGIHAREWVAPAAALFLLSQLVKSPDLTRDLEWRVIPMVNPDGYEYSKSSSSNRYWRKNRGKTSNRVCPGVDLNRNFDVYWHETNHNACSETYSGTRPFSEPESRAVRDAVLSVKSRVKAYNTLHTYGQLILYPYGYTRGKTPPQVEALRRMGNGMANAIKNKYGNEYMVDQASVLGAAAGGSDDWALMKAGVPYSYTLELQSKVYVPFNYVSRGFVLPASKLPQAVDECWLALEYQAKKILQEQGKRITDIEEQVSEHQVVDPSVTNQQTSSASNGLEDQTKTLYPVGWKKVLQEVKRIRNEARANSSIDLTKSCVRIGTLFICPHMIFWNSMFGTFRN